MLCYCFQASERGLRTRPNVGLGTSQYSLSDAMLEYTRPQAFHRIQH